MGLSKLSTVDLVRELISRMNRHSYDECQRSFDDLEREIADARGYPVFSDLGDDE